jgi:hypothetical protein
MASSEPTIGPDDVITIMLMIADIRANTARTVRLLEVIAGADDDQEPEQ